MERRKVTPLVTPRNLKKKNAGRLVGISQRIVNGVDLKKGGAGVDFGASASFLPWAHKLTVS